jgi:hypothetical protein
MENYEKWLQFLVVDLWLRNCVWLLSESAVIGNQSWEPACLQHI